MSAITIQSEEAQQFTIFYDGLAPKKKKIVDFIIWKARTNPRCYVKQQTIADEVKCSRKHVNQFISKELTQQPWFYKKFRAYTSCLYGFADWLLKIDIKELVHNLFRKLANFHREVTVQVSNKVTIIGSNPSNNHASHEKDHAHFQGNEEPLEIPYYIAKHNIPLWAKLNLCRHSQSIVMDAYEAWRLAKRRIRIADDAAYWSESAWNIAKERGEKPNFIRYFKLKKIYNS